MYRGGPRTLGVTGRTGIPKVGTVIFRTDEIVSAAANGALPCGRYWASTGACRIGSRLDISQPHLPDTPPAVAVFSCCSPAEQQQQEVATAPQSTDKCPACKKGATPRTITAKSAAKSLIAGRRPVTVIFICMLMSFNS